MRGSRWAQFFALASTLFCSSAALAYPPLTGAITTAYPAATNLDSCGTCHLDFNGGGTLNAYGAAFLAADGLSDPAAAIAAIANDDSDGDGTSNADEASNGAGFEPGLSCVTYTNATHAPGNLADFVDPTDIGCTGGGSTTTVPATTTTVFVTTTTTGATTTTTVSAPKCSQPVTDGAEPLASDCLFILRTAVGSAVCDPACICDTNGAGGTSASDALLCLKKAVGQNVTLNCQCEGTTTTTLGGTTTTVPATTTTVPAPTTTLPTPTTTLGGGTTTTVPAPTTTLGGGTTTTVPAPTTTLGGGTTTTVGGGTTTTVAPATTTTVGATTTTTIVVSAFGLN